MTMYGTAGDPSTVTSVFLEASDAETMQSLVQAAIDDVNGATHVILCLALAGGGDGNPFQVLLQTALASGSQGGIFGTTGGGRNTVIRCYMAESDEELARAKTAAGIPDPVTNVGYVALDEQVAGSSKGALFMGMTVFSISSVSGTLNEPRVVATLDSTKALNAGSTILAWDTLNTANQFSLPAAQTIQYDGNVARIFQIIATVTVGLTAAGDATVDIVADPLGTPSIIGRMIGHTAAGEFDDMTVVGFFVAEPSVTAQTLFGVRVTSAAGSVLSAQIMFNAV